MSKKTRRFIRIVGVLFGVVGVTGFVAGAVTAAFGFRLGVLDSFEFPLGELRGIAVDSDGHIYCGLQSYSRVQAYDAKGKFLYGRFINSSGGAFRIRINEGDQLEVATIRNYKLYVFDKGGKLVRERSRARRYYAGFGKTGETRFYDEKEDVTYCRKGYPIMAHIVKRDSTGQESVIIKTPFHKWVFQGPLPAWFICGIGVAAFGISGDLKRWRMFWSRIFAKLTGKLIPQRYKGNQGQQR